MKYLKITSIFVILITMMIGCKPSENVLVNYDQSIRTDFSKLKTYSFSSYARNQDGTYTLNNAKLKEGIRNAISYELGARGYKKTMSDPDMLVNFRIFEQPTEMAGYVDVYKDENYWATSELRKDAIGITPEAELRTRNDIRMYRFEKGTLLIDLVDAEDGTLIWKGYASGIIDSKDYDQEANKIKDAVQRIFTKYNYRAEESA